MSTHVLAGNFPDRDRSVNRFLGLAAPVELLSEIVGPEPVAVLAAADRPDWWTDGTLPGVMAGKRPAL
jgi:hypothetical protein